MVIGPRHLDNQPSKFFEYLGHSKPMLVLGPIGNPIQAIVEKLGIGLYVDILDRDEIRVSIMRLVDNYADFVESYRSNHSEIQQYSAEQAAQIGRAHV